MKRLKWPQWQVGSLTSRKSLAAFVEGVRVAERSIGLSLVGLREAVPGCDLLFASGKQSSFVV